jgi:hypothetical protein
MTTSLKRIHPMVKLVGFQETNNVRLLRATPLRSLGYPSDEPCTTSEGYTHGATPLRTPGVSQVPNQVCMTSGYYTTSIIWRLPNNDHLVHNRGLHHCTNGATPLRSSGSGRMTNNVRLLGITPLHHYDHLVTQVMTMFVRRLGATPLQPTAATHLRPVGEDEPMVGPPLRSMVGDSMTQQSHT